MPDPDRWSLLARALALAGICAATAVGALGALATPGIAASGLFCAALVALATGARVRDTTVGERTARVAAGRHAGLVVGSALAAGWMVVTGSALLLGPAAAVLLLLAAVIVGATWWRYRTPPVVSAAVPLPAPEPSAAGPGPAGLSTAQLCLAWQRSYFALLDLPAGASRTDLVHLRQQLLDEIERRDPAGFTRWIDGDARPGSNPGRYVVGEG